MTLLHTSSVNEEFILSLASSLKYNHELIPLTVAVFLTGFIGFLESRDFINVLVNTEVMMLGINFHLIINSMLWNDYYGQVYALCFLAVTAAETAIGIGILILSYRAKGKITFDEFSTLRG
jgi:NADH-quinone oxidoreductase subunit K